MDWVASVPFLIRMSAVLSPIVHSVRVGPILITLFAALQVSMRTKKEVSDDLFLFFHSRVAKPSSLFLFPLADQDVAGNLPVKSLHRNVTRTASKAVVTDALKHCGLAHILPELKHMSGAKLLSMPLDALQNMYSLSGWRLRAVRSLYLALHPPVRIRIEDPASGEGSATVTVASAKEFSELLGAQNCVALRACTTPGAGHLAVRFEDLRVGHAYSPVRVNSNLFGCVEAAL